MISSRHELFKLTSYIYQWIRHAKLFTILFRISFQIKCSLHWTEIFSGLNGLKALEMNLLVTFLLLGINTILIKIFRDVFVLDKWNGTRLLWTYVFPHDLPNDLRRSLGNMGILRKFLKCLKLKASSQLYTRNKILTIVRQNYMELPLKHSTGKAILFNIENLSTIFGPRL